jgi:hypothetical protein
MHELEALERRGWEALSGPGGAAFYSEFMADDGLMVFPGLVLDKAASIQAISDTTPWLSYELEGVRLIGAMPHAATVVYGATAQREGGSPYRALMASVYVRREGNWRLVLHQQTPNPAT